MIPRSFLFFAVIVATMVARYHVADGAAKMKKNTVRVSCSCTKPRSNRLKEKSATCKRGSHYTDCCKKAPLYGLHLRV